MRLLARLVTTFAVLLIAVPVTVAAKTAQVRDKPADVGNNGNNGNNGNGNTTDPTDEETPGDEPGTSGGNGKPDKKPKAEKEKAEKETPPDQAEEDAEDVSEHPLGGPPGKLKEPGEPAHPEHTVLTETVGATPGKGTIKVKLPGRDDEVTLETGAPLPMGSVVDATDGLVEIGSQAPDGTEQNAVVAGGVFQVQQDATGLTDLKLRGGDFSTCRKGRGVTARSAARRQGKGKVSRGLWAAGKGRFRTHGRNATASVRGTRWAVVDRCNSTTVKVFDGVVDVKDLLTGKTIAVRAGERHVARERRP